MSDAEENRLELEQNLERLRVAGVYLQQLETEIQAITNSVSVLGFGSLRYDAQYLAQILRRTLLELSILSPRFERIRNGLEEWRDTQ